MARLAATGKAQVPVMIAEKDFAGRQSRGARDLQEDAYAFSEIAGPAGDRSGMLMVIADGMGGHRAGERASEVALTSFIAAFQGASGTVAKRLNKALTAANDAIATELEREPELEGMGTTLVGVAVTSAGVEWISVGDSPLYLSRGQSLTRLNEDHSLRPLLREMAEQGKIQAPETAKSRNVLRAALAGGEVALIDRSPKAVPLQAGDLILAASDGVQSLNDDTIAEICAHEAGADASVLATRLIDAVLDAGVLKQDNTTVAVVKPAA
jgi:PPM family protein phosphatase